MSCSFITIQGIIISAEPDPNNAKNIIAIFQPKIKDAPALNVKAYGDLGSRLLGLNGYDCVVSGRIVHLPGNKAVFDIDLSEIYLSGEYGDSKAIVNIIGRYSDKYAKHKDAGGRNCYEFQIGYSIGKIDGKTQYANWNCAAFNKNAENIPKYFEDGKSIAVNTVISWYAKDSDKLYLNATVNSWNFVGGRGE